MGSGGGAWMRSVPSGAAPAPALQVPLQRRAQGLVGAGLGPVRWRLSDSQELPSLSSEVEQFCLQRWRWLSLPSSIWKTPLVRPPPGPLWLELSEDPWPCGQHQGSVCDVSGEESRLPRLPGREGGLTLDPVTPWGSSPAQGLGILVWPRLFSAHMPQACAPFLVPAVWLGEALALSVTVVGDFGQVASQLSARS